MKVTYKEASKYGVYSNATYTELQALDVGNGVCFKGYYTDMGEDTCGIVIAKGNKKVKVLVAIHDNLTHVIKPLWVVKEFSPTHEVIEVDTKLVFKL